MKITEADGKLTIDDFEFYGQIEDNQFCSTCKSNLCYYDDYDAYFCPSCNHWTETTCKDPHCKYCPNRPKQPLPSE